MHKIGKTYSRLEQLLFQSVGESQEQNLLGVQLNFKLYLYRPMLQSAVGIKLNTKISYNGPNCETAAKPNFCFLAPFSNF